MAELPEANIEEWTPFFEPTSFNDAHSPLLLQDYQLSERELKLWAERCTQLRKEITAKVDSLKQEDPERPVLDRPRSRRCGIKRSRPLDNAE